LLADKEGVFILFQSDSPCALIEPSSAMQ